MVLYNWGVRWCLSMIYLLIWCRYMILVSSLLIFDNTLPWWTNSTDVISCGCHIFTGCSCSIFRLEMIFSFSAILHIMLFWWSLSHIIVRITHFLNVMFGIERAMILKLVYEVRYCSWYCVESSIKIVKLVCQVDCMYLTLLFCHIIVDYMDDRLVRIS